MSFCFCAGVRRAQTLLSTFLHMSIDIHTFFLDSLVFGLGMDLRMASKSLSSLVGVVGGQRGIYVHLPRYLVCSVRGDLRRHHRNI